MVSGLVRHLPLTLLPNFRSSQTGERSFVPAFSQYRLKKHENRNLYMRARLHTCADVNIMPASVYKLVFHDPNLDKLTPNKLQIGTYTNDTVKIVGTCKLYLVHLDTKKLIEIIFYVATNDGNVLLSCKSTLALDLIQPRSRLDYLPPRASLITSTQDHPK